jgi:hypothetical protein
VLVCYVKRLRVWRHRRPHLIWAVYSSYPVTVLRNSTCIFPKPDRWNYAPWSHFCELLLCVNYMHYTVLSKLLSIALVSGAIRFRVEIRCVEFIDQLRNYWLLNVQFTTRSYLNNTKLKFQNNNNKIKRYSTLIYICFTVEFLGYSVLLFWQACPISQFIISNKW